MKIFIIIVCILLGLGYLVLAVRFRAHFYRVLAHRLKKFYAMDPKIGPGSDIYSKLLWDDPHFAVRHHIIRAFLNLVPEKHLANAGLAAELQKPREVKAPARLPILFYWLKFYISGRDKWIVFWVSIVLPAMYLTILIETSQYLSEISDIERIILITCFILPAFVFESGWKYLKYKCNKVLLNARKGIMQELQKQNQDVS